MDDRHLFKPTHEDLFCENCGEGTAIATERRTLCLKCGTAHALEIKTASEILLSELSARPPEPAPKPARKRHPVYGLNEPPKIVWPEPSENQNGAPPRQEGQHVGNGVNPQKTAAPTPK